MKTTEDRKKGIKLKLEVDEKGKIAFLDVELKRGRKNEIMPNWFRKKENAGIFCNWRSTVEESTKRNIAKNYSSILYFMRPIFITNT